MKRVLSEQGLLQGATPRKQGALYSLELGKSNGPYLAKDLMLSNPKSIRLLAGSEIINSHLSMVRSMEQAESNSAHNGSQVFDAKTNTLVKYDERFRSGLASSDNLSSQVVYLDTLLAGLYSGLGQLTSIRAKFKADLTHLQTIVQQRNAQNTNEIQPRLRLFHLRIKQTFLEEKNQSYLVYREIDQLRREKSGVLQQILFCQKKIMYLEKELGVIQQQKPAMEIESQLQHEIDLI